jgi:hypothetical protein
MMATSALNDITKMPVMPKLPKLATLVQPEPTPKGMIGGAEYGPVLSELGTAKSEAAFNVGQADIAVEKAKREEKVTEAKMRAEELGRFSEKVQAMPQAEALKEARDELANKAFVPTKDNATDLAAMFSLINIVGMLVGKSDAQRSMYAMNGMLEGYQKGRADLYKKEQIEFDKNFKALQAKVATLEKGLAEAMEVAKIDKEKGDLMVTMELAKADSPVLKAMASRQGVVKVQQELEGVSADLDKVVGIINSNAQEANRKADAAERERRADERTKESNRRADVNAKLARDQALALANAKAQQGGFLKPGAKVTEGYTADVILKNDLQGLTENLKNPELNQLLKQYRIEAFFSEKGSYLNQVMSSEIPPELLQFLTKVRDIRNNYYLNISGKAVTGGEAARSYGAVPQPGDDAQGMLNKIGGMAKRVDDSIQLKRQLYGLPEINLREGMRTNLAPGEDYTRDETQKSLPTGEKLKAYADKVHGGDIDKATSYLKSQGYQ